MNKFIKGQARDQDYFRGGGISPEAHTKHPNSNVFHEGGGGSMQFSTGNIFS